MDNRYRDIFAKHVLSLLSLSRQQTPRAALIVRGGQQLGSGYNKAIGDTHETSPIIECLFEYYSTIVLWDKSFKSVLFCTYFPSMEEFIALSSSDIRVIYYMGDITNENTVRFLNEDAENFKIIKLEIS